MTFYLSKTKTNPMLRVSCLCALLLLAFASDAAAAGLFLPGHGVRPLGRAGSFVASGEGDLNSLWHNPANLATLGELKLTVDLSLISLDFQHTRAPRTHANGDVTTYETVRNEAPPKPDPQILVGGPLMWDGWTWAFGVYAPYLSGHTFPEDGPQRYVLIDNDPSLLLYMHAAVAWNVSDWLRIGAGIQNVYANFVLVNTTSAYPGVFCDQEDRDLDILTRITLGNALNLTGNFGIWAQVMPMVEAAISVQLPTLIRDREAKLEAKLPSHPAFADAKMKGDTLDASMNLPFIARVGGRFNNGTFDYELSFVYEGWSAFKELSASPNNVVVEDVRSLGDLTVAPLSIPMHWRDTWSIRNGVEVKLMDELSVRGGYAFEATAIPDEYYSVFLAEADKHLMTLGGTWSGETWSLDLAFAYYLMADRKITNSKYRQINPTDAANENTLVVANGDYKQRYMIVGLGFNKTF